VLAGRIRETEETIHKKEAASQEMEESLRTEIRDLQSVAKKKEEDLESRQSEVNDLKSKTDALTGQVTRLGLAIKQAEKEAASEAQNAEQIIEGLKIKITTLETQFREAEQILGATEAAEEIDPNRNRHSIDSNGELDSQMNAMEESKAEALLGIQAQAIGTVVDGEQLKTGEEKPTAFPFEAAAGVTPTAPEAGRTTVSQDAFDRVIAGFGELANVIESIASLIVRDHVRTLGESMEEFPQRRLPALLESLSQEMPDDKLKAEFCERFATL
jgi:hypothetical protein